jgi:hypothetical protein
MQQTSHQTLSPSLLLSTFTVFMVLQSLIEAGRLLLKARDSGSGVIRLMFAVNDSACQHKFPSPGGLFFSFYVSFIAVQRKQDG